MTDTAIFIRLTREPVGEAWVLVSEISDIATDETAFSWVSLKSGSGYYVKETADQIIDKLVEAWNRVNGAFDD